MMEGDSIKVPILGPSASRDPERSGGPGVKPFEGE